MSQNQSFGSGGGGGGSLNTLTGDIGPAVTPTANNINVLGLIDTDISVFAVTDGSIAASTLKIGPAFDAIQTTDAVPKTFDIAQYDLAPSTAVVITANVIGAKDDYTAACGGLVTGIARRAAAGGTVLVGQNPLLSRDSNTGLPIFGLLLDGNAIKVGVMGVAAETWNWTCTYQYQKQIQV